MTRIILSVFAIAFFCFASLASSAKAPHTSAGNYIARHFSGNHASQAKTIQSVDGVYAATGISLSWTTARKLNKKHFELEYSADGITFSHVTIFARSAKRHAKFQYVYSPANDMQTEAYFRLITVD